MKPWKLWIDWTEGPAYVELHIMDGPIIYLRKFPTPQRAIDWALKYMDDRGVQPGVVQPVGDRPYVVLHAVPVRE